MSQCWSETSSGHWILVCYIYIYIYVYIYIHVYIYIYIYIHIYIYWLIDWLIDWWILVAFQIFLDMFGMDIACGMTHIYHHISSSKYGFASGSNFPRGHPGRSFASCESRMPNASRSSTKGSHGLICWHFCGRFISNPGRLCFDIILFYIIIIILIIIIHHFIS